MNSHFDVYDVMWVVRNFYLATCPNSSFIQTPEFTIIGSHTTKWELRIEFRNVESNHMTFYLHRCDLNTAPVQINVNWRLSIHYPDHDSILIERFCVMEESAKYRESLRMNKEVINIFNSAETEFLTFKCTMIIYTDICEEEFQLSNHKGKRFLSESLINMLNEGIMCDLALKIDNRWIMAHKAIMCARLEIFRSIIEESRKDKENVASNETDVIDLSLYKCIKMEVVDLSYLDYNAVESLVRYVYSGDLIHVLLKPTLGIYDCVKKLRICKEMISLEEKILTLHSSVEEYYEFRKSWTIKKCSEHLVYGIQSPHTTDEFYIAWQLFFVPNSKADYFSVFILPKGQTKYANMWVELAVLNKTGNPIRKKKMRCSTDDFNNSEYVGFPKFIRKNKIERFLKDDQLCLDMKMKLTDGILESIIVSYKVPVVISPIKINSFDLLSLDMNRLLQTREYADVDIYFMGTLFILHRCILTTRSRYFFLLLEDDEKKDKINFLNITNIGNLSIDTYNRLFTYLYSGVVETEDEDQLNELKQAAAIYNLPDLKELVNDTELRELSSDTEFIEVD